MAIVQVVTAERTLEIEAATIVGGQLDEDGHLILTKGDGTTIDAGSVMGSFSNATDENVGVVELATDLETAAGTDADLAVTPFGLASLTATEARRGLVELATTAEAAAGTDTTRAVTPAGLAAYSPPLDADLQTIAGLSPANDSVLQRKAGAWVGRTMAQLATDVIPSIQSSGEFLETNIHNGTAYVDADSTKVYVGPVDPGGVPNGSVWFDTTGA